MASMAPSEASKPSKLTNPKPLLAPVSGSRMILGVAMTIPNALKVSYSSCRQHWYLKTFDVSTLCTTAYLWLAGGSHAKTLWACLSGAGGAAPLTAGHMALHHKHRPPAHMRVVHCLCFIAISLATICLGVNQLDECHCFFRCACND